MKIILLCAQNSTDQWIKDVEALYSEKLRHYISFEIFRLKNKKLDRDSKESRVKSDSEQILNFLTKDDFVALFDEKGKSYSSEQFSLDLQRVLNLGKKRLVFIIGGPFGVNEEVKSKAGLKVSLSTMVFNHQVAEAVALEQIYRAFTIIKNIPYHNK